MSPIPYEDSMTIGPLRFNVMRTAGEGAPLLFLHGVTRCWRTFLPLMPGLGGVGSLHSLDFRGHGASDRGQGQYCIIDYVPDVVGYVLDQFDGPVVLYGHSLGAMVAAAVAAEVPELVRAVILEDPPFDTMGSRIHQSVLLSLFKGMQRLAGSRKSVPELACDVARIPLFDPQTGQGSNLKDHRDAASIRFTAMALKQLDPEVLAPVIAGGWLAGYQREEILRGIACPTLLLQADIQSGGMLTDHDALECSEFVTDLTAVKLAGAPHLLHWAKSQEVANLVMAFIASLDGQQTVRSRVASSTESQA